MCELPTPKFEELTLFLLKMQLYFTKMHVHNFSQLKDNATGALMPRARHYKVYYFC